MSKFTTTRAIALLLALALIASACGSDDPEVAAPAEPTPTEVPADPTPAPTEVPAGEPEPDEADADPPAEIEQVAAGGYPVVNDLEAEFLTTLLHGMPTSNFLWRHVLPELQDDGYVVAPDLIGMGRSGQPDIDYTVRANVDYLDAFLGELGIETAVLVMHDVGGLTGLPWAGQNPDRVTGVVMFETGFADPQVDDEVVYDLMVENFIQLETVTELSEDVLDVYRAPWNGTRTRDAMVAWPQQLPIGGEPADANELMTTAFGWISSADVPKLLLFGEPGFLQNAQGVAFATGLIPGLATESVGDATHYLPEDVGDAIGQAVSQFIADNDL